MPPACAELGSFQDPVPPSAQERRFCQQTRDLSKEDRDFERRIANCPIAFSSKLRSVCAVTYQSLPCLVRSRGNAYTVANRELLIRWRLPESFYEIKHFTCDGKWQSILRLQGYQYMSRFYIELLT